MAGPATSPGPDGWMPAELKYLPAGAFGLLAALYNAVEEGASWPKEVLKARAVALPKTAGRNQGSAQVPPPYDDEC
eukprot:14243950-Alexandrium_andersonii.AAC.1